MIPLFFLICIRFFFSIILSMEMIIKLLNDIYQIRFRVLEYNDILFHLSAQIVSLSYKKKYYDSFHFCNDTSLVGSRCLIALGFDCNFSISTNLLCYWDAASHRLIRLSMGFVMIVIGNVVLIEIVVVLVITITYLIAYDVRIEFTDFQPIMWKLTRMMELGHQF